MKLKSYTTKLLIQFAWGVLSALMLAGLSSAINLERVQSVFSQKYGAGALPILNGWLGMVDGLKDSKSDEKTKRTNEYINRKVVWSDDQKIWGQPDYWATPLETLGKLTGDCEDFAIIKYYTLISEGVPISKLRLVYVKAKNGNTPTGGVADQAHMVLAYYPSPDSEPMIMDNLITEIRPASRRPDLEPVFSFNSEGVYSGATSKDDQSGTAKLSRWQDLLQRAKNEGFE